MIYDYCVIGGGIVGLATAMRLLERRPGASLILLEKETALARHQTGHNSGVIHSGIYYPPESLKAELCRRGARAIKDFCAEHSISVELCGKLIVATSERELRRMEALYERSSVNMIATELLSGDELQEREPNVSGIGALYVPGTGIVDYRLVCECMANVVRLAGGEIRLGIEVTGILESHTEVTIAAGEQIWCARTLVACAGLQSDRLARMAGIRIDHQIIPFRGEYYRLPDSKNDIVRHLIYPLPDPELPFLGIHLTRTIDGHVTVGPNAVLGLAREGYEKRSLNLSDVADYLRFPGFWRTAMRNGKSGLAEMGNSIWKPGYLAQCQKYCPSLTLSDLLPCVAGIRAQAVTRSGAFVDDFLFVGTARMLHVCNAPSPAATSAIPIADNIVDRLNAC